MIEQNNFNRTGVFFYSLGTFYKHDTMNMMAIIVSFYAILRLSAFMSTSPYLRSLADLNDLQHRRFLATSVVPHIKLTLGAFRLMHLE